jgi:hypothetical protein
MARRMNRTAVTYGKLDRVLRSLGFSRRMVHAQMPEVRYEHVETGAFITVPRFPDSNPVMLKHLIVAKVMLDWFGIADPKIFDASS